MIDIRVVSHEEFKLLFEAEHKAHAKEVKSDTFTMPLNPNFEAYQALQDTGSFLPLAAFIDGHIAGYLNIIAQPAMCSKDYMVAVADGFYVNPEFRRMGVMNMLVEEAEAICRDANIASLSLAVMSGKGGGSDFVKSLGYTEAEITYTKILEGT